MKLNLKNIKIKYLITSGFSIVALVLVISIAITFYKVKRVNKSLENLLHKVNPATTAINTSISGLHQSLATLRGWIILGKDKFKAERSETWNNTITPSYNTLKKYAESSENISLNELLKNMDSELIKFKKYQKDIEDIAHRPDNLPAMKILFTKAAPKAAILVSEITRMIDIEFNQKANRNRKELLGIMADIRGTTGLALANIRAFLISGEKKFKTNHDSLWKKNEIRFNELSKKVNLLTSEQAQSFKRFKKARSVFEKYPPQMFKIRLGSQWNMANAWLGSKAAPTAAIILKQLEKIKIIQDSVTDSEQKKLINMESSLRTTLFILLLAGSLLCAAVGFIITRLVTLPLQSSIESADMIAKGDFTKEIKVTGTNEPEMLLMALKKMTDTLVGMISNLKESSGILSNTTVSVNSISGNIKKSSNITFNRTTEVSSITNSLIDDMVSVAAAVEEASTNISMVATAAEEMTSTLSGISENTDSAGTMTEKSVDQANKVSLRINELGVAANEIGKVTETINEISEQTNLLALNATIEAARAGEAGKGFAVVAAEIKDLATQTANATHEIRNKIEGIQNSAKNTVIEIEEISKLIVDVNEIVLSIAGSVSEQADVTSEIAISVSEASSGINEISQRISEVTTSSQSITKHMSEVSSFANTTKKDGDETGKIADALSNISNRISLMLKDFILPEEGKLKKDLKKEKIHSEKSTNSKSNSSVNLS